MHKKILFLTIICLYSLSLIAITAPDFRALLLNGDVIKLSDFRGKVVLLDFWATWCPPCRESIPKLVELNNEFSSQKFKIISISLDSDQWRARKFIQENKMNWMQIVDVKVARELASSYGVRYIPDFFLVGKDGQLYKVNIYSLEKKIRQLLRE